MRDDAASIAADLVRLYGTKLQLLDRLLLSESDKIHYCRSGNLEKVFELVDADEPIIGDIDAADFDIAKAETSLAALAGVRMRLLYTVLRDDSDAEGLIAVRNRVLGTLDRLLAERARLGVMLQAASGVIRDSIDDLSRLSRLKEADAGDIDRSGQKS